MKKAKYIWNNEEYKKQAKGCQWGMLLLGIVGIGGFFMSQIPFVIGIMAMLLVVYIYAGMLRSKDKKLAQPKQESPYDVS